MNSDDAEEFRWLLLETLEQGRDLLDVALVDWEGVESIFVLMKTFYESYISRIGNQ